MVVGAIAYALSFDWMKANVLSVWRLGKVTFADLLGVPLLPLYIGLAVVTLGVFALVARIERRA
jgi:hypothetical protein